VSQQRCSAKTDNDKKGEKKDKGKEEEADTKNRQKDKRKITVKGRKKSGRSMKIRRTLPSFSHYSCWWYSPIRKVASSTVGPDAH
jgi:hypothetical protein